jgi:hypothetical protein
MTNPTTSTKIVHYHVGSGRGKMFFHNHDAELELRRLLANLTRAGAVLVRQSGTTYGFRRGDQTVEVKKWECVLDFCEVPTRLNLRAGISKDSPFTGGWHKHVVITTTKPNQFESAVFQQNGTAALTFEKERLEWILGRAIMASRTLGAIKRVIAFQLAPFDDADIRDCKELLCRATHPGWWERR